MSDIGKLSFSQQLVGKEGEIVSLLTGEEAPPSLDSGMDTVRSEGMIKGICHQLEQTCWDVDLG
jgi:hypothetical protein